MIIVKLKKLLILNENKFNNHVPYGSFFNLAESSAQTTKQRLELHVHAHCLQLVKIIYNYSTHFLQLNRYSSAPR